MNGAKVGAIGGLTLGAGLAGAVGALLARLTTTAREIERYADDIAGTTERIADNLAATEMLQRTGELADGVHALLSETTRT